MPGLRNDVRLVDPHDLMRALAYISRHGGVTGPELSEHLGASVRTVRRLLRAARSQFGVVVEFHRNGHMRSGGEFAIDDWGVFDSRRVLRMFRR